MKVTVISFDFWGFDRYIISELQRQGTEATHINLIDFKYKHPSPLHRIVNALNKLLFKQNVKKLKRQDYVINQLKALPQQDIVLVIRPDLLDKKTHLAIKQLAKKYYAYLYDSTRRFPVDNLLDGVFDRMFSFDEEDVRKYGFEHISNYIYLGKKEIQTASSFEHKVFMVISGDERLGTLNTIAAKLDNINIDYKFIVRASRRPADLHNGIEYSKEEIWQEQLMQYLDKSEVFLDLVRHGHNGLSFRIFEAMAYQKKLITTNASVKNYDFYNPDNIMVIDPTNVEIDKSFFETPYQPLDEAIYHKYTIEAWVKKVFFNETGTGL